jgi:hypothetical protein
LGSGKNNSTTNKCVFFFGSLSVVDGVHRMATEKFSKSAKLQALMIQLSRWLFERKKIMDPRKSMHLRNRIKVGNKYSKLSLSRYDHELRLE